MLIIRRTIKNDLKSIMEVENNAWPEELQASYAKLESRLHHFPYGFFCAELDRQIVGFSTSMLINYEPLAEKSWDHLTGDGFCSNHHHEHNDLYVVSLGVHKQYQNHGVGSKLILSQIALAKALKVKHIMLGSRIPDYHKYKHLKASEYIKKSNGKEEPLDSELRFYNRFGFSVSRLIPDFEKDSDSLDYGVVVCMEITKTDLS